MKIALVFCPLWDRNYPVYSLASLSAQLRRFGHEVRIVDLNMEMAAVSDARTGARLSKIVTAIGAENSESVIREDVLPDFEGFLRGRVRSLLDDGFHFIGFSIFYSNAAMSAVVANLFKSECPDSTVVFGGPQCFDFHAASSLARTPGIDAVISGEADEALPALVNAFEKEGRLRAAPGILLHDDPATWIEGHTEPVVDMDALPYADYSGHRLNRYQGKTIHTCRGCVRKCVFCGDWRLMRYRQMSGSRIFSEFAHQLEKDPGVKHFMFGDSLVNGVMKDLGTFCDLSTRARLGVDWRGFAIVRPEMTPGFLERMQDAGCRGLAYGVEAGSDKVSKEMGKIVSARLNGRVLKDSRKAGIETTVSWMVGFPTETEEDFEEGLRFLRAQGDGVSYLAINLFGLYQMMGDEYWGKYGLLPTDHAVYWRTRDGGNTFPVRLRRIKRTVEAAMAAGIKMNIFSAQGSLDPREIVETQTATMLEDYHRWEKPVAA